MKQRAWPSQLESPPRPLRPPPSPPGDWPGTDPGTAPAAEPAEVSLSDQLKPTAESTAAESERHRTPCGGVALVLPDERLVRKDHTAVTSAPPAVRAKTKDIVRWFEIVQWLQGSWVPEIVVVLAEGPTRFQDLGRAIRAQHTDRWWSPRASQLSNSQLSRTLQAMHRDELILRHEDRSGVPITVTYELSPLLRDFLTGPIGPGVDWLRHHDTALEKVRERHRQRHDHSQR